MWYVFRKWLDIVQGQATIFLAHVVIGMSSSQFKIKERLETVQI